MSPRTSAIVVALGVAGLLGGCGKGYDQEVVLQLFRPLASAADKIVLEADQGPGTSRTMDLPQTVFASCSENQVRIIPRESNGSYAPVHVVVRSGALKAEATVPVPASNPVTLVLRLGDQAPANLEPAGTCQPTTSPDGGPPLAGLGSPCGADAACQGAICLLNVDGASPAVSFPAGYCSSDCSSTGCGTDGSCYSFKNGLGDVIAMRCLKTCKSNPECPGRDLYCTPGELCMPQL